jgi:transposase-like protein
LKDLIELAKELPEESFDEAYGKRKEIKDRSVAEKASTSVACPFCGLPDVVRNGKQAYLCKECGKSFVEAATSAIAYSHSSETVWKQGIRDTVDGISIDKTAERLALAHSTVFNMRHKILCCVEVLSLTSQSRLTAFAKPTKHMS